VSSASSAPACLNAPRVYRALLIAVGLVLVAAPAHGQRGSPAPRKSLAELTAEVLRTTKQYRDAVARSLPAHEANVREAAAAVAERRRLHAAGALPASYVIDAEQALAAAERELAEAQDALDEADRLIFEGELQQRLARLAPLPRGGYEESATLVRFNGPAPWSLGNVASVERKFVEAFNRAMPISAYGQTKVHDRLGLDHRTAIDVAVHPDSPEGQWLMRYLRGAGIPFIGVRGVVAGASTGAHVHVGPASPRLLAR
jgi:hypothetical protein